jgi:hypothetical protein
MKMWPENGLDGDGRGKVLLRLEATPYRSVGKAPRWPFQ